MKIKFAGYCVRGIVIFFLLTFNTVVPVYSQDPNNENPPDVQDAILSAPKDTTAEKGTKIIAASSENSLNITSSKFEPIILNPKNFSVSVQAAYDRSIERYFEHQEWELQQRERIYEWQYYAGILVFVVAISVVIAGLVMSWLQFRESFLVRKVNDLENRFNNAMNRRLAVHTTDDFDPPGTSNQAQELSRQDAEQLLQNNNEITLSLTKIQVTTSVVGVIILTLSIAFFYLYLKFVFTIS